MEKTKGTIKSIDKMDNDPWTLNGKTYHDFYVTMEDAAEGRASSLNEIAPPYKVGDEVEYTATTNHHGTRMQISKLKANGQSNGGANYSSGSDEGIKTQWAIGRAVELTIAEMPSNGNLLDMDSLEQTAREILEIHKRIMS
jgi:hypothetical protein